MNCEDIVTYKILSRQGPERGLTVFQYVNGICTGGDMTWLYMNDAERAMRAYESGRATHGNETESSLRRVW